MLAGSYRISYALTLLDTGLIFDIILEALIIILNFVITLTFSYTRFTHSNQLLLLTSYRVFLIALSQIILPVLFILDGNSCFTIFVALLISPNTVEIVHLLNLRGLGARAHEFVIVLMGLNLLDTAIFLYLVEIKLIKLVRVL